jgi:hypothetical protein
VHRGQLRFRLLFLGFRRGHHIADGYCFVGGDHERLVLLGRGNAFLRRQQLRLGRHWLVEGNDRFLHLDGRRLLERDHARLIARDDGRIVDGADGRFFDGVDERLFEGNGVRFVERDLVGLVRGDEKRLVVGCEVEIVDARNARLLDRDRLRLEDADRILLVCGLWTRRDDWFSLRRRLVPYRSGTTSMTPVGSSSNASGPEVSSV